MLLSWDRGEDADAGVQRRLLRQILRLVRPEVFDDEDGTGWSGINGEVLGQEIGLGARPHEIGLRGEVAGVFLRISENPGSSKTQGRYGIWRMLFEIEDEINAAYRGHHQFDWIRPRQAWLESTCPVYIDFGEPNLVRLEKYDVYQLSCIRYVPRDQFVRDALSVARTADLVP